MDEDSKIISHGDAWYIIHEKDFDEFLTLTKMESVRAFKDGRLLGFRGYHTRGWDELVLDISTMDVQEELDNSESRGHKL